MGSVAPMLNPRYAHRGARFSSNSLERFGTLWRIHRSSHRPPPERRGVASG